MNQQHSNYQQRKRRAPRTDLSKLTAEEQTNWKKARARQYSALARQRQVEKEVELKEKVETLSMFQVLVKAAPDAVLLLSPDVRARILFVNDRCGQLLKLPLWRGEEQTLVGRCLWEWMNGRDKEAVVAAIGKCVLSKDMTRLVQVTLCPPPLPPSVSVQQQEPMRVDLTLRSSERGLVLFLRPEGREG